jgi:dienelactone hydrolase
MNVPQRGTRSPSLGRAREGVALLLAWALLLAVAAPAPASEQSESDAAWSKIAPYFQPPDDLAGQLGDYRPVLQFDDGRPVRSAEDWQRRRKEILDYWFEAIGRWPPLLDRPEVEVLKTESRDGLEQRTVRVQVADDLRVAGYVLVPEGASGREGAAPRRLPAVLVVFYDPEAGAGLRPEATLRDFGYQLARRGFVALSIGWPRDYTNRKNPERQTLSTLACLAANCHRALAAMPEVDPERIGVTGHSFGGKWALFAACLYEPFACGAWSDPGVAFDERRPNVNYWEPWYLGWEEGFTRKPGVPTETNPRTGPYKKLMADGRDLHELQALMAPRPFLVSGGAEDPPRRWEALNHAVAVNKLLGFENRVAMTNRPGHSPTEESNEQLYLFFEHFLKPPRER